ncbi:MAG: N-acetylmuramoyl-L-alanine amidase, partial [Lentisphaeria bacterium]|nr:N-acetylmuramoyl-L-alanine amidase [Lentisphaeria bacterium]
AAENSSVCGIETFAMTPAGAPSSTNTKLEKTFHPGNRCDINNLALANMIHRYMLGRTGGTDRGVKRARFQVLREITMPGVLIECGFISNPAEVRRMATAAYQEKLAKGIADGVHAYRLAIRNNKGVLKK